ncbi:MAG: hypothetical protein CM1200mP24_06770 [Gammaproteobacteria bacterium]|nr:MAG: hypothetical protein CM1200mP24_06770 [Gammaproteobacteria bacterium]
MRYSLIGREVTQIVSANTSGLRSRGNYCLVACDKPPVGTQRNLEHNRPAIIMSDGSVKPGPTRKLTNP